MKHLTAILFTVMCIACKAQTEFKFVTGTPFRDYHEVAAVYKDGYILKFTNLDGAKRNTGKFAKYSTDNKLVVQKPYSINFGYRTYPIVELMLLNDNKARFVYSAASGGTDMPWDANVMHWRARVKDYSIQPFDLTTMQATGTPKIIGVPTKKDIGSNSIIYSSAGNRMAIMANEYNVENTFKYKLMDATGNELFTKEYTVPAIKNWKSIPEHSVKLTESGELAFLVGDYLDYKLHDVTIVRIDANQKMYTKKVEAKGKYTSHGVWIELSEDGSITLTAAAYADAARKQYTGKVILKYSATLELLGQEEEVYPAAVLATGANIRKLETGGYVVIKKETGQRQTGPQKWDNTYSNYVCTGFDEKFNEIYKYEVHKIEKSSTWCIYRPFDEYIEGDNIYVFHGGTDDKVKNTKEEFELYCTYWQHGKTKPTTVKLQRPFPDLDLQMAWFRVMDKNKLFIQGEGNGGKVYTTLTIQPK